MAELVVFTGPMFSSKSSRLIDMAKNGIHARKRVLGVIPEVDTRTPGMIATREICEDGTFRIVRQIPAVYVRNFKEFDDIVITREPQILCIDEVQFFGEWIVDYLGMLMEENRDTDLSIYVSGLDMDFSRKPFGYMPDIFALANEVHKATAICFKCGAKAQLTQKLVPGPTVEVDDGRKYEARCWRCHDIPGL